MSLGLKENKEKEVKSIPDAMNAMLFYGPRDIRYEKIPTPKISENEILIKVKVALTGGTDLKTYERGHPVLIKETPSPFGHQFSGEVRMVGTKVKDFKIGQRVTAMNSAPCFKCKYCKEEKYSLCEDILFLNGAYAEYIAIPERIVKHNTYEIPYGVTFESAALVESLAVILHGLDRSKVTSGKIVCIIGTGSIGLLFVLLSKILGATVISVGRKEEKLEIAKELGADYIVKPDEIEKFVGEDNYPHLRDNYPHLQPEVVIEATGQPEIWELATKIVRKGGLVNFFGGCKKGTKVTLDTYRLHYDELKLIGVFHHTPKYVQEALQLLKDNPLIESKILKIITHKLPLSDLEEAFKLQKEGKAIQVAINP